MKLRVIIGNKGELPDQVEIDGDLSAAKTFIKLKATDKFNFAAIERLDELKSGDVNRWVVNRNTTTGELVLKPFSFYDHFADPAENANLNLNAMQLSLGRDRVQTTLLDEMLGGGKF